MNVCRITVAAAMVLLASTAGAAPMGKGALYAEIQGTPTDNTVCTRITNFDNQSYNVFGPTVNLASDLVDVVCVSTTVAGVPQPGHCSSYPSSSIYDVDALSHSVCVDPPGCSQYSFVSDAAYNVSGSLPAAIGSGVVYLSDGQGGFTGNVPSITIPGCPLSGAALKFEGTIGLNAFKAEGVSSGLEQTVSFPDTTFYNPLTNQIVPIDVDVNFANVVSGGTTTVTASSNATATIPSNFAFDIGGFQAAFLDITTTAQVESPIRICTSYLDADNDGVVDGTTIPEAALSFMHGEGDPKVFVDRTLSRDPVGNLICASVDSLSPLAVLVRTTGICAADNDPCDDGDACTTGDHCDASLACVGGSAVTCSDDGNACTADICVSPIGCTHDQPVVAGGCNTSNALAKFLARYYSQANSRNKLSFKWQKGTIAFADFGQPTVDTRYTLCASDANRVLLSATVAPATMCGGDFCWTSAGPDSDPTGVKYKPEQVSADDYVKRIVGKTGDGKSSLLLQTQSGPITMDFANLTYPITVQVLTSNAGCWSQQFTSADEKNSSASVLSLAHKAP